MDASTENWTKDETRAIHEQLERILESDFFAGGERQCRFLRYIVESTLIGKSSQLNQFAVGIEVFDRDESFDPSTDAIVRVEAGRLRSKLAEYYANPGGDDAVLIGLPRGGYTASIEIRSIPAAEITGPSGKGLALRNAAIVLLLSVIIVGSVYVGFFYVPGGDRSNGSPEEATLTQNNDPVEQRAESQKSVFTKPAIAILPFDNMSADSRQDYFSDGITEDIITDLSIVSGLTVIARHSTFVYKNRPVSIKEVSQDLGVQYVLEGSVRRAGDRLRITAQLIDASTETHLWADRYDRDVQDVFLVQDDVTRRIVNALQVTLTDLEDRRLGHKGTDSIEAYDHYLHAQEQFYTFSATGIRKSIELLSRSIELDPTYAEALAWKSRALVYAYIAGFNSSKQETIEPALALSRESVEIDELLPMAHANLAWTLRWDKKTEEAITAIEIAIGLDPNSAEAFLWKSLILSTDERGDESLAAVERGMRLNPYYGVTYIFAAGRAHFVRSELETALRHFDRGIARNPNFIPNHVYKLFALQLLQRNAELGAARTALARANPNYEKSASYLFYFDELSDIDASD